MSKFKFITLVASTMLALVFTISCSNGNDEGGLDGSLDGIWQLGQYTIEIDGTLLIVYNNGGKFKGTISYNGSSGTSTADFYWDGKKWQELPAQSKSTTNFSYKLSADGKTLTISGITGEGEDWNGDWTKKE